MLSGRVVAGPPALRSERYPRGFPRLDGRTFRRVEISNEMADRLAKRAAEGNRVGAVTRSWLKSRFVQAKELAIFVGRLTHRAGAHPGPEGALVRDSTGFDAMAARQARNRPSGRKSRSAQEAVDVTPAGLFERSGRLSELRERIMQKAQATGRSG